MFNIGPGELALILVAALIVLGPKRLPEMARALGKFMREFRRQTDDVRNLVEREFYKMDQELSDQPALHKGPALVDAMHDSQGRLLEAPPATVPAIIAPVPAIAMEARTEAPAAPVPVPAPPSDPKTGTS